MWFKLQSQPICGMIKLTMGQNMKKALTQAESVLRALTSHALEEGEGKL